ncbi:MAG: hypothetical protein Q7K40_04395 [bacterium]|nr:hypothetical protein [bacterium]
MIHTHDNKKAIDARSDNNNDHANEKNGKQQSHDHPTTKDNNGNASPSGGKSEVSTDEDESE